MHVNLNLKQTQIKYKMAQSEITNVTLAEAEKEVHFQFSLKKLKLAEANTILSNFDPKIHSHVTEKLLDPKNGEVYIYNPTININGNFKIRIIKIREGLIIFS